jgi:dihydroflavonol-4-reductase
MRKVFVTGSTGFIGASIVRLLLHQGFEVKVLVRTSSDLRNLYGLDVEKVVGDLRDSESLRRGMAGCDTLFHAAADYRLWCRQPAEMYQSNVQGTTLILGEALRLGYEKVVYTSSVGTLGNTGDCTPGNETTPVSFKDMVGDYKKSKFLAEQEALSFVAKGLPLVVVNPSTPVGPWDIKPTPTGKIIVDFLNGNMPAYIDTGLNIIAVEDCAAGHVLAAQRGRIGEKYILGNENLALREIFCLLAEITGQPPPRIRLPYYPLLTAAAINAALSRITGRAPLIPLAGVMMARKKMFFDSSKALKELGLPQRPVRQALQQAVDWFRKAGYAT